MLGRLIGPGLCQQLLTFPRLMVIATSYWLSINMGIARALQPERERESWCVKTVFMS